MTKIEFLMDEEHKLKIEAHKIIPIKDAEMVKSNPSIGFNALNPSYMVIRFLDEVIKDDLEYIYDKLVKYKVIEMLYDDVDKVIKDDLSRGSMKGTMFEIKCYNFRDAFECAADIIDGFWSPVGEKRIELFISETPSKAFAEWLRKKATVFTMDGANRIGSALMENTRKLNDEINEVEYERIR